MEKKSTASQSGFFRASLLVAVLFCAGTGSLIIARTSPATAGKDVSLHSEAPANTSQRALSFAERVSYQRAIEEVYWHHRIWPKDNPNPKPSLDAAISQAALEEKVQAYLRDSQALEDYWHRAITAEQLQAEMDRMAQDTKQPEVLRELFKALGNDPFLIAECLARPILTERLLSNQNKRVDRSPGQRTKIGPEESSPVSAENQISASVTAPNSGYILPTIADVAGGCTVNTWRATAISPVGRDYHTAVWTGTEMIVWGGLCFGCNPDVSLNTGGRYNPSTDSWTATSTANAPSGRWGHTAVWTGSEMIIWGGVEGRFGVNTGGRYNPVTNSWTATSTVNAPPGGTGHTAVWTGTEMIISSGGTGGKYNPNTNSWTATSTINAPSPRSAHTAVWTGSEMIVWGGTDGFIGTPDPVTGGRYNPNTDSWTATSTSNVPFARYFHTAVWTGSEMIVWGGINDDGPFITIFNDGGKYNPSTNSWTATSTNSVPEARDMHTAVWTGSEMIVWGGMGIGSLNTGGKYNPVTNSWTATSTINAPTARDRHTAVWTGTEMIVWGGEDPGVVFFNTGGRYCGQSGPSPTPTPTPSVTPVSQLGNISTRAFVQTGDNVMIGGFIIEGTEPKRVIIRAIGPELTHFGVPNVLIDPTLEVYDETGALIASNDNWQHTIIGGIITSDQVREIMATRRAPLDPRESAIIADLPAGNYTAIVRGVNNTMGVALVEAYDLSPSSNSILRNISTRGLVQTGDNVMIGGFIVQGTQPKRVILRAIGSELSRYGVPNVLPDPTLELHDGSGRLIASNDDWQHTIIGGVITADQVRDIQSSGFAPRDARESAIIATLAPGNYTGIVRGKNIVIGIALAEVYDLDR
jgi:N-acetylneuraminic acid mutarotase